MALTIEALDNVGVEVSGFDITQPVDDALAKELVELWNEHAILVFRGQDVNPQNQIAFSRVFGELEMHPLAATTSKEYPELFTLVNDPEKEKYMVAHYNGVDIVGRLDWHMDLHYTGKPNRGALLRAVVCAEQDGLTGFGDLAKAYDALDEDTKALLEKLEVTYAFSMQRRHMRYVDVDGYEPGAYSPRKPADIQFPNFPEVSIRRVVTHPVTGRKSRDLRSSSSEVVAPHKAGFIQRMAPSNCSSGWWRTRASRSFITSPPGTGDGAVGQLARHALRHRHPAGRVNGHLTHHHHG
ncbi:MAG: TauD/TfdA family dioxygenase [Halioglobus sp.]